MSEDKITVEIPRMGVELTQRDAMWLITDITILPDDVVKPPPPPPPPGVDTRLANLGVLPGKLASGNPAPFLSLTAGGSTRYELSGTVRETRLADGIWQGVRNLVRVDVDHDGAEVSGGAFICPDVTPDLDWDPLYQSKNSPVACVLVYDCGVTNTVFKNMRLHGGFDGFAVAGKGTRDRSSNITLLNAAMTGMRDDAIENDSRIDGLTVEGCLFDGVFVFFSCRNTGTFDASDRVNTVRNSLIRLLPCRIGGVAGRQAEFFKVDPRSVNVDLINVIFAVEQKSYEHGDPFHGLVKRQKLRNSSGNTICWLGAGAYPFEAPGPGFTILAGTEARKFWDDAVAASWKAFRGHRFGFDPS